jgi:arabinogalactan endo-1,4-beta-galactosidase
MKIRLFLAQALLLGLSFGCGKSSTDDPTPPVLPPATNFAYGADASWVTQMEAAGQRFYNSAGTQQDLFTILQGKGITAIRLRVWVDPANGWNNTADVVAKAKRATALGMRIMVDFHYSDSWADPGQQTKPTAWAGQNASALAASVNAHTLSVLNALKTNGVTPLWVQVGNETSDGMLWQEGRASVSATSFHNFADFVNAGYSATKAVFPNAKVIVHVANGQDNTTAQWLYDGLRTNGANWDVCGLSLYPASNNWGTMNAQALATMQNLATRYGKEVMICEVGMSVSSATACRDFITDLIAKTKTVPGGLGVFYWEPEAYANWQGYTLGAFDASGRPTVAMDAFMH